MMHIGDGEEMVKKCKGQTCPKAAGRVNKQWDEEEGQWKQHITS